MDKPSHKRFLEDCEWDFTRKMARSSEKCELSLTSSKKVISSVVYTLKLPPNLFSSTANGNMHSKDSPSFEFANATWCFRIYPNGRLAHPFTKHFHISIVRKTSEEHRHKIFYTTKLLSLRGEKYYDFYNVDVFDKDNLEHGVAHFIVQSVKHRRQRLAAFSDETLELICELFCDKSFQKNVVSNQELLTSNKGLEILSQDLKELFLNGQNHDLILKVADKEFRVHQSVLIARCEVFKSMLSQDTEEKKNSVIDVQDCDSQAMEQFLFYIYSGKVQSLNQDCMLGLYYIADKYNIAPLKRECGEFIKKSLSPSNICDVIQLMLNHDDMDMLQCATEYFVNHTNDILPTVEWMSFLKSNFIVANELLIKASNKWHSAK